MLEGYLTKLRAKLLIPERWRIRIVCMCEDEMPEAYGYACWDYLQDRDYTMLLLCSLSDEQARYIIAHELLEIATSDYAEFTVKQIDSSLEGELRKKTHEAHANVRNEVIQWLLPLIFGIERPLSLAPRRGR